MAGGRKSSAAQVRLPPLAPPPAPAAVAPAKRTPLDPPGYEPPSPSSASDALQAQSDSKPRDLTALKEQRAWDLAIAPAKNVPMQAFMMYMTGGGVQIFSLMSVWYLLRGAVAGIFGVESAFATLSPTPDTVLPLAPVPAAPSFTLQKLTFVACQLALLAIGIWKCNSLGILPTHSSDWLAFRVEPEWVDSALL